MKTAKQKIVASGILLVLVLTIVCLLSLTIEEPASIYTALKQATHSPSVTVFHYSEDQTHIEFNPSEDPFFCIPFENHFYWDQKIAVKISASQNISTAVLYLGLRGKSYSEKHKKPGILVTELEGGVPRRNIPQLLKIEYRLPADAYQSLRFDFEGQTDNGSITIESIQVSPFPFYETITFGYFLTLLIGCSLIVPGTLIFVLLQKRNQQIAATDSPFLFDSHGNKKTATKVINYYLITFFALSLLFYLLLYLIWEILLHYDMANARLMLVGYLGLMAFFIGLIAAHQKSSLILYLFRASRNEFIIFFIIISVSFFVISFRSDQPFNRIDYQWIAYGKTCDAFRAHDNVFQFVNGKVIADNEPFEKYYAYRTLWYNVQDREMLPGVVYGVYRKIIGAFSVFLEKSYLTYTILGTCMNAMVIFPLIVIFRRYSSHHNIYLFALFVSLNAFVLINYYYTWFKFTGAALFLSGLIFLMNDSTKMLNWIIAGFLFGLSTNMHAGNALALPLFFLWFVYQNIKKTKFDYHGFFIRPVTLIIVFFLVNLPWSVVKKVYFREDYALIKENYLHGASSQDGLLASVILFFKMFPLKEQIALRWEHLSSTLRLTEIGHLFSLFLQKEWDFSLHFWNQLEFYYILPSIYPMLLFCALGYFHKKRKPVTHPDNSDVLFIGDINRGALLGVSLLTSLMVIVASYSPNSSDLTYLNPMGTLLIIHTLLIGYIMDSGKLIGVIFSFYILFTSLRLASSLL